jgi:hypothetical protein
MLAAAFVVCRYVEAPARKPLLRALTAAMDRIAPALVRLPLPFALRA